MPRKRKPKTTVPKSGETGRQRYNKMVKLYKAIQSAEKGIPQRKVLVRGPSESAKRFREFYKLLTLPTEKKPKNWRERLGDLGFGRAFWTAYREQSQNNAGRDTDYDDAGENE